MLSYLLYVYANRGPYAAFAVEGCREREEVMTLPDRNLFHRFLRNADCRLLYLFQPTLLFTLSEFRLSRAQIVNFGTQSVALPLWTVWGFPLDLAAILLVQTPQTCSQSTRLFCTQISCMQYKRAHSENHSYLWLEVRHRGI